MTTEPTQKTSARPARGLGRGLDVLFPANAQSTRASQAPEGERGAASATPGVFLCAIEKLAPRRDQPRQRFDSARLDELATSLREHGLIQPLVVRRASGEGEFEIIAGERRWRAAQRAGLTEVLVVVRDTSLPDAFELALIENVQREDLDPIELAEALERLATERGYTQEQLAERVGKDRTTITNLLRLLRLPPSVRAEVARGTLTEGHARALLGLPDTAKLERFAAKVIGSRLSVRQTEALVRAEKQRPKGAPDAPPARKSAGLRDLEHRLTQKLGARCEVADNEGRGEIRIRYTSLDELDRLLEALL